MSNILKDQPLISFCSFLLICFYSLNFAIEHCPIILGLVPVNTLVANSYIWNLVTSCFYEENILKLCLDFLVLLTCLLNPVSYSPVDQYFLYFVFSILGCTVITSVWCFGRFFFTGMDQMLLEPIYGFGGVLIILLMHIRTQHRDVCIITNFPDLTFNNIPIVILVVDLILWIVGLKHLASDVPFCVIGLLFSWSYLRFYIKDNEGNLCNQAEELSFVSMFPESLHVVMVPLCTAFYNLTALIGVFPKIEAPDRRQTHHLRTHSEPSLDPMASPVPTRQADVIAERRKARALKLLDAKMQELTKIPEAWEGDIKESTLDPDGKIPFSV